LPKIEEGDLLAVLNAGAYGFAMSSQYNARPRAAEVLVKDGKYKLVREREQLDDLMSSQQMSTEWQQ
jgi:diaminopimelate decarboxylase